jgi:hypothetical protein
LTLVYHQAFLYVIIPGKNDFTFLANVSSLFVYLFQKIPLIVFVHLIFKADLCQCCFFQEGFIYHHAEPGYVMLTCWLPDGPAALPSTSLHQIGVGAFVMNEKQEVMINSGCCILV